jgi:hypothetical protein
MVHDPSRIFGGGMDDGTVNLPLAPGSYTATVRANGYASVNLRIQAPSPAIVVPLTPGGKIVVKSKHTELRRIRLLDPNGIPFQRYTTALPAFELLPQPATTQVLAVAPGTYTVQLLGDGDNVVDSAQVTVREGAVAEVEI